MKTMTYGVLPTREEFDAAFDWCSRVDESSPMRFAFSNDPRVGTCALTRDELWQQLKCAQEEMFGMRFVLTRQRGDLAGQWCSDVLGVLGFEWI